MTSRCGIILIVSLGGCTTDKPQAAPDLAQAAPVIVPPAPLPPPPPPKPPAPSVPAGFAAVQVAGQLTLPVNEKGAPHVYVSDGECWKPGARAFLDSAVPGAFTLDVVVPAGASLWVCAALVPEKVKKATWYGGATRGEMKAEGEGQIVFAGLDVPLRKGAPVALPPPRPSSPPAKR